MNSITFYRGDSYPIEVIIWKDVKNNELLDITGSTFVMTVNIEKNPVNTDNQLFFINGVVIDYDESRVQFEPSGINTDLPPGKYWYDITMITGIKNRTIHKDNFIILQDITK